jgi:sigma-B regulation protein RsbU (phosphoserine phosphatase)
MGAAMLMSSTITSSRVLYDECEGPLQLVRRLNAILFRSTDARSFVTLFAGWLDPVSGRLRYVNAGHPEPVIARAGRTRQLEATGVPVAMLPTFAWQEAETTLEKGELFVLFSDGVSEAQRGTEFFDDVETRVPQTVLEAEREPDVERGADRIITRIDEFAAGAHRADDVTLVLLRRD